MTGAAVPLVVVGAGRVTGAGAAVPLVVVGAGRVAGAGAAVPLVVVGACRVAGAGVVVPLVVVGAGRVAGAVLSVPLRGLTGAAVPVSERTPRPLSVVPGVPWPSREGARCTWLLPLGAGAEESRSLTATLLGFSRTPDPPLGEVGRSAVPAPSLVRPAVPRATEVSPPVGRSPAFSGLRPRRALSGTKRRLLLSPLPSCCAPRGL